jgi:putative PIN family toxin of toxin-antitoxin system
MRVVLDTNVMLAGLRSRVGASRIVLQAVDAGVVTPLCNVAMMLEYEEVLKRPDMLVPIGLASAEIDAFLDAFCAFVEPAPSGYTHHPLIPDSSDETFLEAAINANADALLTFNTADYRLTDPTGLPHGVVIQTPGEFLRRLKWRPPATTP